MALDRPATIRIYAEGLRDSAGRYIPGPATDYRVWLTRTETTGSRLLESDGTREEVIGVWRLRWFRDLADADLGLDHELLVDGSTWVITAIREVDNRDQRSDVSRAVRDRRRWLAIEATEQAS